MWNKKKQPSENDLKSESGKQREARRVSVDFSLKFEDRNTTEKALPLGSAEELAPKDIENLLKRLDHIISEVRKIKDSLEQPVTPVSNKSGQVINLSGKGLCFLSEASHKAGDLLQMQFALPLKENFLISILGKVIWTRKLGDNCEIAVKFLELSEEDENNIIKYTFMREREELREKKR